jgi:hypothetical protein
VTEQRCSFLLLEEAWLGHTRQPVRSRITRAYYVVGSERSVLIWSGPSGGLLDVETELVQSARQNTDGLMVCS